MLSSRTSKSLSARVAPVLPARSSGLRNLHWAGSWGLAALAGCWLLWQTGVGDDRVFHAGSISTAHQFIAHDCARCHQSAWQPLKRLVSIDNTVTSTPDAACIACHAGPIHNDHPAAKLANCAHCHREHHGQEALAALDDRYCTDCHANLEHKSAASLHFASQIAKFAEHSEFALFRADVSAPSTEGRASHGLHRVAKRSDVGEDGPWRDRAAIRFNHHKHMQPEDARGLPTPALHAAGVEVSAAGFVQLDCDDCHQPDSAGRYMQPIGFEQHCRRCHPLEFDAALGLGDSLPHRDPQLVRDVMRSRLGKQFRDSPADSPSPPEESTSRGIPGIPAPSQFRAGELDWVNQRLSVAEHVVFGKEAKGGCRFCHTVEERGAELAIVPPAIPDRWQTHARFDHRRHRLLDCAACHARATASSATADILLPRIAQCRECHGAENAKSQHADDRCIECHDFHDHRGESLIGKLDLELNPLETRRRGDAEEKTEEVVPP